MPKRPDYDDATPEDLAIALMRLQRPPLKKPPEPDKDRKEEGDETKTNPDRPNCLMKPLIDSVQAT